MSLLWGVRVQGTQQVSRRFGECMTRNMRLGWLPKIKYATEREALTAAEEVKARPAKRGNEILMVEPYVCGSCGLWHIGGRWPLDKLRKRIAS